MSGGVGLTDHLPMSPFANALVTQYQTPLPDAHDLAAVRRRVGEIAPEFDRMRGFHFKLYGVNAPGTDDAAPGAFAEYSSLYLWHGPAGANEFFTGGRFDGYGKAFGRPMVRTWFVHAVAGEFAALAGATHFRRGTAAALLFLSLGYSSLPAATQKEALVALEASPVVASLADAISARILVNPYAVLEGDATIAAALKSAFDALSKGGRAVSVIAKTRAELPPIASITPGDQSEARILQTDDSRGLIPTNLGRRPAVALTYRTGFQSDAGRTDLPAAARIDGPQELPAVTSWIGSLFTLGSAPAGAPVQGSPVALSMEPGASKTYFETVVLMASGKTDAEGEPSFFSQPRYAQEVAEWRATRERLNRHAWISGIFFDLVKSALGGAAVAFEFAAVNAKIALFEEIEAAAESKVLAEAAKGAFGRATQLAMERLVGSSLLSSRSQLFALGLIEKAESAAALALRPFQLASLIGMAELVLGILAAAGTLLALGDLLTTYSDVVTSEKGSLWSVTLLKPTVALSPPAVTIAAGASQVLSVSAVAVQDGNVDVTYKWKTDNPLTNLSERDFVGSPNVGREITTKTKFVTLATTPSTTGKVTVTVEGFVGGTSFGTATSVVTLSATPQYSTVPGNRRDIARAQEDRGETFGRYAVVVEFTPPPGEIRSYTVIGKGAAGGDQFPSGKFSQTYLSPDSELALFNRDNTPLKLPNTLLVWYSPTVADLGVTQRYWANVAVGWTWEVKCVMA